jgi:hypothetical protein
MASVPRKRPRRASKRRPQLESLKPTPPPARPPANCGDGMARDRQGTPITVGCIVDDPGDTDCGRVEIVHGGYVMFRLYNGDCAGAVTASPDHQLR